MNIERVNHNASTQVMSTVIKLRISNTLKDEFMKQCNINNVEMASTLRALIQEYIDESKCLNEK